MSKKTINLGTVANDKTGTTLRTGGGYINDNFTELWRLKNTIFDTTAKVISDEDDQYAHESHMTILRGTTKTFLLFIYQSNKTGGEADENGISRLKVYDLTTQNHLISYDVFENGVGIFPATGYRIAPKVQVIGTTIRCFVGTDTGLYARDIEVVDDDTANWTVGNTYIMQMTMKNAAGEDVLANVTPANIQTHLEYTLGDTYAGYVDLIPILRNFDKPVSYGGNLYSLLELNGEFTSTGFINTLIISADGGDTWAFTNLVRYTTAARTALLESSLVLVGTSFYVLSRTGSASNTLSITANAGSTWTTATLPMTTLATKPCAINYYNPAKALGTIIAINETSEVTGNTGRTTLAIYSTTDFATFTELARIVTPSYAHYPSLLHYSGCLFVSYTKGLKYNVDTSNPQGYDRNSVVLARIY